jgi:hypothetical protein
VHCTVVDRDDVIEAQWKRVPAPRDRWNTGHPATMAVAVAVVVAVVVAVAVAAVATARNSYHQTYCSVLRITIYVPS